MSDEKCSCPLLKSAAAWERSMELGLVPADSNFTVRARIKAINVGVLRERGECPGVVFGGICPFYYTNSDVDIVPDPGVPLLKRKIDDGQGHKYL